MKKPKHARAWLFGFTVNLAGVIIGILLTFGITFLVQHRQEREQAHHVLAMVRAELESNRGTIENQKRYYQREQRGAEAFEPWLLLPERIPMDTLDKYREVLHSYREFSIATSALELLKGSPQVAASVNSDLLHEIFELYVRVNSHVEELNQFYHDKDVALSSFYDAMDIDTRRRFFGDSRQQYIKTYNERAIFAEQMRHYPRIRVYIEGLIGNMRGLSSDLQRSEGLMTQVDSVMVKIDKEVK